MAGKSQSKDRAWHDSVSASAGLASIPAEDRTKSGAAFEKVASFHSADASHGSIESVRVSTQIMHTCHCTLRSDGGIGSRHGVELHLMSTPIPHQRSAEYRR